MDTNIGIKVTADTAQAQNAMGAFSNAVGAVNITSLAEQVKALESNLNAATPKNMAFAETFNKIQADLAAGTISLEDARAAVSKLSDEMGRAPEPVEKTTMSLADFKAGLDMAIGVAQKAGEVFQAAFDMAKEGATIEQTHDSLDRMATSAGVASDLLGRLEAAAGGTVDDLVLAGGASRLMAGQSEAMARALGNAAPELVTISRAMAKLSPTVGDSTDAFEALTEAMQTGRTRGLQQWGFDITKIKDDQDLLNQVLDQGRGLVNDLGGDVESATDKYAEFEQGIDNLNDAFVTFLNNSKVTSAVIGGLTQNLNDTNTIIALHEQGVISTTDAWRLWAGLQIPSEINATKAELEALVTATAEQERETQRLLNATTSISTATVTWAENTFYAQQAQEGIANAVEANTGALYALQAANDALAGSINFTSQMTKLLNDVLIVQGDTYAENNQRILDYLLMTGEITQAEYDDAVAKNKQVAMLEKLNGALAANMLTQEAWNEIMKDGKITTEEMTTAVTKLWGTFLENTLDVAASDAEEMADAMGDVYDNTNDVQTTFDPIYDLMLKTGKGLEFVTTNAGPFQGALEEVATTGADAALAIDDLGANVSKLPSYKKVTVEVEVTGDPLPNVGGYGGGHPTGPTTPTASLRVGDTAPTPAGTDWQAVFLSLTEEQRRKVQDMVGTSMYEADYAAAITKVLKNADLNDAARKLDRGGGRTVPRGDAPFDPGGLGGVGLPFSGGGNLAAGGNTIIVMIDGQEVAYRMQTLAGQSLRVASMSGAGMLGQ